MKPASLFLSGLSLLGCSCLLLAEPCAVSATAPPPGFSLVVSSFDAEAREAVVRGIQMLLTAQDESALAEFRTARRLDPSCVMASWGILFSTLGSDHDHERTEALAELRREARLQDLLPQERYLCEALAFFLTDGAEAAVDTLSQYASRFPRDPLPIMGQIVFLRNGYDAFGNARPQQERALQLAEKLLESDPASHTALFLRALLEETAPRVSARACDCARRAARLAPRHAATRLLLGHLLARSGRYGEAAEAFEQAATLYEQTRSAFHLAEGDDDGQIRALLGLAVAQWQQGEWRASLQTRRLLKTFPIDPERLHSKRSRLILWEVRSLPARLALAGTRTLDAGDLRACMAAANVPGMPQKDPAKPYLESLKHIMEARLAITRRDHLGAQKSLSKAEARLAEFTSPSFLPGEGKDAGCVARAREAVQIALFQTRAQLTPSSAHFWNQDAQEIARPPSGMLPMVMPSPPQSEKN